MNSTMRNLALICAGAFALSGCDSVMSFMASSNAAEADGSSTPAEAAETVVFLPAQNPIWAEIKIGRMACAAGASFQISRADADKNLDLTWQGKQYTLHRVTTTSGAFRYEDAASGMVLIQIPAKSQLLNTKLGQRLADECKPG